MDNMEQRRQLVQTGIDLLRTGLVARTWGNVSSRLDEERFLITPSGLDYTKTRSEDIAVYNPADNSWEGPRKPSSEKGIHAAAYDLFPEVNFVIHTHQTYATALGLTGWDSMDITPEETARLGGIARADYGLPGQKSLRENVKKAMATGARVVFMVNHGVVVCGRDHADAMEKTQLLEAVCRRNCRGGAARKSALPEAEEFLALVRKACPNALLADTPDLIDQANRGAAISAQLDDMAQMIGLKISVIRRDPAAVIKALRRRNAVLVPGLGAVVCGRDDDDTQALCLLAQKAAVSARHCAAWDVKLRLPLADALVMKLVYDLKYSKQKG